MKEPVGLAELPALLGVSKVTTLRYIERPDFPRPWQLRSGRVWDRGEVEDWARRTLPLPVGRPRRTP